MKAVKGRARDSRGEFVFGDESLFGPMTKPFQIEAWQVLKMDLASRIATKGSVFKKPHIKRFACAMDRLFKDCAQNEQWFVEHLLSFVFTRMTLGQADEVIALADEMRKGKDKQHSSTSGSKGRGQE